MHHPTVIHATHWKAGSQWVRKVLLDAVPDRVVPLKNDMSHITAAPIVPGGVYTPCYLRRNRLMEALGDTPNVRSFVVLRDPRDVLVSWYFSLKFSHTNNDWISDFRNRIAGLDDERGILEVLHGPMWSIFDIQRGWLNAREAPIFRYEDLLEDEQAGFEAILRFCEIDVGDERRRAIVERASFQNVTGRRRGEEDVGEHHRKAIAGDWRNYFTPRIKDEFKAKFGNALVEVGYESHLDW